MTKKASINAARESFSTGSLGKFWFYANLAIFVFIICLAVLPSRIFAADQGLTGYWPMDEATTTWDGAGDRVNDYSGLGNNGTAYGHAHATTTAVYGNAGEFDGTDDYVYLGDTGNNFGTTQTVSAWIYPRVITGNNFRIYATGSGSAYPYTIGIYNGALIFADRNNVNDILYSSIPLVLNTWQYITVVTTGSQAAAKLYINGVDRTGAQGGSGFIFS
ncbi:MAG: hypothetical protein NTZ18_04805, partial [Candidatus Komeilibacteria bacterium]|nr:hypothetical protein [Candidatus Komeilibacteria bacterium]